MSRVLLLLLLLPLSSAQAARIVSVSVTPTNEGDVTSLDTVNVELLVDRAEPSFRLRVRGFVVSGEANDQIRNVNYDETVTVEVPRTDASVPFSIISKSFSVPFNTLQLPNGPAVKLGFVATALPLQAGSFNQFEMASKLQSVRVEGTRKKVEAKLLFAADNVSVVEARNIGDDGTLKPVGQVSVVTPTVEPGSITLQEQERSLQERMEKEPHELAPTRPGSGPPTAVVEDNLVYFATNRKITRTRQPDQYTFLAEARPGEPSDIVWGTCKISLPTRQQEQSWWSKAKATVLTTQLLGEAAALQRLSNSTNKDVFLFVHGYCNTFEDSVLQAGRMKRDLLFRGNALAFSWPSAGNHYSYSADEWFADDQQNLDAFAYVLNKTVRRAKAEGGRVYLLAHSMGNRFLVYGLRRLYLEMRNELVMEPRESRTLAVVAFAAPDVDLNVFASVIPSITSISEIVSLYYSTWDRALRLSGGIHDLNRAGLHALFNDDMGTINTDRVKGWFSFGHSYYSASDRAILDLMLQFQYHRPPSNRTPPLEEDMASRLFKHWYLTP